MLFGQTYSDEPTAVVMAQIAARNGTGRLILGSNIPRDIGGVYTIDGVSVRVLREATEADMVRQVGGPFEKDWPNELFYEIEALD